ncbi:hypothetical protein JAGODDHD_03090 [Sphingomonas paucimobilis]|nr:hypothetical protein [Sphingomonas paucimobilis]
MKIIIEIQATQPMLNTLTAQGYRNAASRSKMMNRIATR